MISVFNLLLFPLQGYRRFHSPILSICRIFLIQDASGLFARCRYDEILHRALALEFVGVTDGFFARFEPADLHSIPGFSANIRLDDSGFGSQGFQSGNTFARLCLIAVRADLKRQIAALRWGGNRSCVYRFGRFR